MKFCVVEVRNPAVRHLIDESRKNKRLGDHELVNEIKPSKGKFQGKAQTSMKMH